MQMKFHYTQAHTRTGAGAGAGARRTHVRTPGFEGYELIKHNNNSAHTLKD